MTKKNIKILIISFLSLLTCSCSDESKDASSLNGSPSLIFKMGASSRTIIDNTQVYLFDDGTWNFKKRVLGVSYETDKVSMQVDAGTWNIGLVTANADISADIISPVRDRTRESCKLWETKPVSGALPSMPELRTAGLASQVVLPNQLNTASETAKLDRNVALIKVVIEDANGLVTAGGTHHFELKKVPTTLNWAGGLYPDKDTPDYSSSPMKGQFKVVNHSAEKGRQISDTLMFIVPAHKGNDYLSASPVDTTTHQLNLSVDLECEGTAERFKKEDIVIPRTPKVNTVLLVRLYVGGKLEVTTEILNWKDVDMEADLSQTQLHVDRTSVGLAHKDTIYVNTNADDFTVDRDQGAGAAWLSVRRIDNTNGVEITADVNTYVDNEPRESFIEIKANHVTKKIPVTQRPDRGTISVDNKRLVFCPVNHEQRSVQINSIGGDWKFITQTYKATPDSQLGSAGESNVTFTRASTTSNDEFDKYYGDSIIVVKNIKTLDTDTISLINCFIDMYNNTINASAPTGNAQTAVTVTDDVVVYGGSRDILVTDFSNWIHSGVSWNPSDQKLTFTTDREKDDEARTGYMTFYHAECSDYIVTANVYQDILVTIPPFDFFVVKFIWDAGSDVDIMVEFSQNNLDNSLDNKLYDKIPVGWRSGGFKPSGVTLVDSIGVSNYSRYWFKYKNRKLLEWGGDATSKQGETAFFNAPVLEGDTDSPRKVRLDVYANWYSGTAGDPMAFSMTAYKGGKMIKGTASSGDFNRYNFYNVPDDNGVPGETLYSQSFSVAIGKGGYTNYATGGYTYVATIVYDRIKHSAFIEWHIPHTELSTRSLDHMRTPSSADADMEVIGYDEFGKPIYSKKN